jgi:hypothetical protein
MYAKDTEYEEMLENNSLRLITKSITTTSTKMFEIIIFKIKREREREREREKKGGSEKPSLEKKLKKILELCYVIKSYIK